MASTARQRRHFLIERLSSLAQEIDRSGRAAEIEALATRVAEDQALPATPSDDEWDLLLPGERSRALPAYYLKLRTELAVLNGQGAEARRAGRLSEWLDGPVPKSVAFATAFIQLGALVAAHGEVVLRSLGLGYELSGEHEGELHRDLF